MIKGLAIAVVVLFALSSRESAMELKQLSPVIFVDEVEPCLPFWEEGLGFQRVGAVEHEGRLGFVMLARDSVQIMYQSYASAEADVPAIVDRQVRPGIALYLSINGLDATVAQLRDSDVVVPERVTFYGAREVWVRAPCGTVVGLAEMEE